VTNMLYAYGDDPTPLPETVRLLDEIIVEYVTPLTASSAPQHKHGSVKRARD
jgi:hypothetical protein